MITTQFQYFNLKLKLNTRERRLYNYSFVTQLYIYIASIKVNNYWSYSIRINIMDSDMYKFTITKKVNGFVQGLI